MLKKGGVEVQFNWIFVFVAGALIFALIIGFVNRQVKTSEKKVAGRLVRDLNTIVTQSSVSAGKSDSVDLPQDIRLICDAEKDSCSKTGCASKIEVSNGNVPTEALTIFSAPQIKKGKLRTWTQGWSVPFRVMNFVYLSEPRTKFVFVGDDPLLQELHDDMPEGTSKLATSTPTVTNNNILRLVYIGGVPNLLTGLKHASDREITALNIKPDDGANYGDIVFYKKVGSEMRRIGQSKYVGKSLLFGAIYSTEVLSYECGYRKALVRLQKIAQIYLKKAQKLVSAGTACSQYSQMKELVVEIYDVADELDIEQSQEISQNSKELKSKNHELKIRSCPTLY